MFKKSICSVLLAAGLPFAPVAISNAHAAAPYDSLDSLTRSASLNTSRQSHDKVERLIKKAKVDDPEGFAERRALIASSAAFMEVLVQTTASAERSLDFFAAISSREQAEQLVASTAGRHFVITGTESSPNVQLVDGEPLLKANASSMPRCGAAWAAFSAWLAGSIMVCAPFSGPAAWICAAGMGVLGLMPDFNAAC